LLKSETYVLTSSANLDADLYTPSRQAQAPVQPTALTTTFTAPSGGSSAVKKQVITKVPRFGTCTVNGNTAGSGTTISNCYDTNQVQSTAYYDFGSGAPGGLLRTDTTSYQWQVPTVGASYFTANLLNLPAKGTQTGPGINTETDYSYDQPTYFTASTAGTHQGTPPASVSGNTTTITQVSNNGLNSITHTNWYGTGVPSWTQDANLGKTTYLYSTTSPLYGAYPTTITNALNQPTQYTYDANLGKPLTVTDANGQATTYSYPDPFGRLRDVVYPNVYPQTATHGETTYLYTPSMTAPSVTLTMKVNATVAEQIEQDVDGVGRLITTKTTDGSAVDQVDTNYDANGHVASVSNPHRPSSPQSSDGTTGYTYDALGRMLTQTQPDGGVQRWSYNGQTVDFFDETNRHRQRVSDGLGRLITVLEPDASNTPVIPTQYQYDGNGNLLNVDQTGGGSGFGGDRVRAFSYDSLSRLVAAKNPENLSASSQANLTCPGATGSWTSCYGYDPNGNLVTKTDNRNVTTTYGYDALNRLKSKTYTNDPNNTPPVTMVYDSIANGVNTVGRLVQEYTGPSAAPLTQRIITQYDTMGRVQQENQCVMGSCATGGHTLQYSYDLAGNLYTETNGVTSPAIALTYNYDAVNRLSSVTNNYPQDAQHPTTLFSATSYGPVGLAGASLGVNSLSSVTAVTRTLTYDSRQRILTDTENGHPNLAPTATISGSERSYFVCTSGNCRSHTDGGTLTVTVNGFAATATYAAGSTSATVAQSLTNALNGTGSPVQATLSGVTITMSGASSYTMSTSGTVTEGGCNQSCHTTPDFVATLAGGVANGPLYSYALSTGGGATPGYAPNGNVIGFTDSVQGQWGFMYDNMNRMTSGTPTAGPYNGLAFVWSYDPFGNRQSQTVSGSSSQTIQSTPTFTFAASATNHVDNGSYDAMGNMTHDQLNSYAYDAEGRLCAVSPQAGGATGYLYDAEGQRWAKGSIGSLSCNFSSNGFAPTSTYLLGPAGEQLTELNGSGGWIHTNVFAAGSLLATYDSIGTHFALADWLGTKRIQASATGGIDETCMSLPFGDSLTCMGPDATEHHFTGKEHDIESGNEFFLARYSGSTMGRFMSPDSGVDQHPENPQTWNLYSYGRNNPLVFIDPTGEYVCGSGVTQSMCDNFQNTLNAAQNGANALKDKYGADSTQYTDAQRAIDAYGKEGVDNGVTLNLKEPTPGNAAGVDRNIGSAPKTADNPLGIRINVNFGQDMFSGDADNAPDAAHEGSHVADGQDWARGGFSPAMDPTRYGTESRAFHVGASIAEGTGWPYYGAIVGNKQIYYWKPGWTPAQVNSSINQVLGSPAGNYHLTPNSKVLAFQHNTKGGQ
jgi:RHS repeat-associated protein